MAPDWRQRRPAVPRKLVRAIVSTHPSHEDCRSVVAGSSPFRHHQDRVWPTAVQTVDRREMAIDLDKKADEWKEQLETLAGACFNLAHIDAVFWQVHAIFGKNDALQEGEPVFQNWMVQCYARSLAVGLRALVDNRKDVVSFKKLVGDMIKHREQVLTRERCVALYTDSRQAQRNFDALAGERATFVPKRVLKRWSDDLDSLNARIRDYCNQNITHLKPNLSPVGLTSTDLRLGLRAVQKMLEDCEFLLKASVLMSMEPAIQGLWTVPFRTIWIPPGKKLPPFERLKDVKLPGED